MTRVIDENARQGLQRRDDRVDLGGGKRVTRVIAERGKHAFVIHHVLDIKEGNLRTESLL